ncbi:glycosyltransferase family 2 protein [Bariatricus sp. HCP28S3_D3]|uniref:glycosyltransferase family 2 protein n=1 Tax=Bariatricus sp. HCP28S3_D3 TaxID=3438901 RepID=UPI003F8B5C58
MNNIKISIVIPAYNISQYINSCLKSILNQTWHNLEVIVVDDGSTDNTVMVVESCAAKDDRIKIIKKENGGVTSARLAGVVAATGEFIGFVDGDDIIEPDMYERLLRNAIEYSADISHCGYQMVFPNRIDYYYNTGRLVKQDKQAGLRDLFEGSYIEPGLWNKLFHKTLFHRLLHDGIMDISIKNNEDLLMNYYLFKESSMSIYEDWCPYHYLVRKGSAANAKLNEHMLLDPIKTTKILLKETRGNDELQLILSQRLMRQWIVLATMPLGNDAELILPHKRRARRTIRENLFVCISSHGFCIKLKFMLFWVAVWPWSYEKVHKIYGHVTGISKKYDID